MENSVAIYRSPILFGKWRVYSVLVDNKKVGKIKNNETLHLKIPPGKHTIQIKIDFIKTNLFEINLKPEQKIFLTIDRKYLPKWEYFLNILAFGIIVTVGSFFGILGAGIGGGIGSIFLIKLFKPYIYLNKTK